jgi:hypothetical protein
VLITEVPMREGFDRKKKEFVTLVGFDLKLEHSLVSLSKWESNFKKPFLSDEPKTPEETLWYVKTMILNDEVPEDLFDKISKRNFEEIYAYIDDPMTATWFNEVVNRKRNTEVITAEVIYYWMVEFNIPVEFQHWHLNRLLTLIKVCNQKKSPPKKMSPREILERQRSLNEQRLAKLGTKG